MTQSKFFRLDRRGDTIVEVLLAIAVMSAVLGGAFMVTQRSARGNIDSQEHAIALKLLEGQIEQLRAAAGVVTQSSSTTNNPFNQQHAFCMSDANVATGSNCTHDSLYTLSIQSKTSSGTTTFTFTATCQWPRLGGGNNQEQLVYRVYPGS